MCSSCFFQKEFAGKFQLLGRVEPQLFITQHPPQRTIKRPRRTTQLFLHTWWAWNKLGNSTSDWVQYQHGTEKNVSIHVHSTQCYEKTLTGFGKNNCVVVYWMVSVLPWNNGQQFMSWHQKISDVNCQWIHWLCRQKLYKHLISEHVLRPPQITGWQILPARKLIVGRILGVRSARCCPGSGSGSSGGGSAECVNPSFSWHKQYCILWSCRPSETSTCSNYNYEYVSRNYVCKLHQHKQLNSEISQLECQKKKKNTLAGKETKFPTDLLCQPVRSLET